MSPLHIRAFALLALTFAAPAAAQGPNPNNPYIQSISYGGTGCRQGTIGLSIAADRLSFTVIFDQYIAFSGPNVPTAKKRANCDIQANLAIPPGSGESCVQVEQRGYAQIAAGMTGNSDAKYDFRSKGPGRTRIGRGDLSVTGPASMDYLRSDESTLGWSAHASNVEALIISSSLALTGQGQSMITTDSIDGKLQLGACEPPPNH